MAAPRKKKKTPPFDVTGIDFSVIRTALETGGKMIEQIMNGIQYGSPEVRLLMLEECDFILECRVCRGLFRALPNFIAHKRVYCCRAYSDFVHDTHFQSATGVESPPEEVIVVEPEAPEDAPPKNLRQPRQAKDKGKEQKKDKAETDSSGATTSKKASKAQADNGKSNGKQPASQPSDTGGEKSNGKTRSQQSEKPVDKRMESLRETVSQIESGQLGKSQEYAFYTAAANKTQREKSMAEAAQAFHLTPIAATPCAVFVNKGSVPSDQADLQSASSLPQLVTEATEVREKHHMKNSPKEGSTAVISQEQAVGKSASSTQSTTMTSGNPEYTKKTNISKAALRGVTKVIKELRKKKEECTAKELASQKNKVHKTYQKNRKPIFMSILSESKTTAALPTVQRTESPMDVKPTKDKPHLRSPSPTPSCRSTDQMSEAEQNQDGSLRAVVKRCLTGRPGSVRVSPFKAGDRNIDGDNVSEAGSYSDKAEAPTPLLRQDSNGDQGAMDLDNLRCTLCNKQFAGKKSLMYHCQSRHSGQRTIFPCPYCPRVFYYFWGLTRHLNTNHKKTRKDIDRMRKTLHRKAYKQNVVEEHMVGSRDSTAVADKKSKDETPQKVRPSVHAKKMVAASKSVSPSSSGEVKKSPPNTLYMPSRRRRVEVITSVKSKCKQSANLYKKVYANKKAESFQGSPVAAGSFSPPLRTRKLVAKALRTTRSKRVYNRSDIESPPLSPETVIKKTAPKTTSTLPSSKREQSPDIVSSLRSSVSEKVPENDGPKESKPGTAAQRDCKTQSQKSDAQHKDSKTSDTSASGRCKPAAGTPAESPASKEKSQGVAVKMSEPSVETKSQPQTRTRTSSGVSDVVATTSVSSGPVSSQSGPRLSKVGKVRDTSPQVTGQGRSDGKVTTDGPSSQSSGLLHICPHCQRAFGRKISLESHTIICTKAKGSGATSQAAEKQSMQASSLTHKSNMKKSEDVANRGDSKSQEVQAQTVHSSSRTTRDSYVEKSALKSKVQPRLSTRPPDLKSNSKSSSSRESSVDRQVASSKAGDRQSRSRTMLDSKASSSRESSVDSIRSVRSNNRPVQLSAERVSRTSRRESESSQDSLMDSRSQSSKRSTRQEGNLLTISRQRLSEQLLAATTSRDKDPSVIKPRSDSQRGSVSGDSVSDSKKTDLTQGTVARSSPEKPSSSRTVTTSVLRKGLKGKLPDSPRKSSLDSQPGSSSNSASPVKQNIANPKRVLERQIVAKSVSHEKSAAKPVLQGMSSTKSVIPEKPATKPAVQDSKSASKPALQEKLPTKPLLQDKSTTKPVLQEKVQTKPAIQQQSETKPVPQEKSAAKLVPQDKPAPKPVTQAQDTSTVLRGEMKKAYCSSVQAPDHPQNQQVSTEAACAEAPSPQHSVPSAAAGVSSAGQPLQESPSELNQRPRRKRRAPARVMDGEVTLPKCIAPKKKACQDPGLEQNDIKEESTSKRAALREQTSSDSASVVPATRTRKDNQVDKDPGNLTAAEDLKVERRTGRPSDRTRSRIYVVEPSHAGRLTCQDIRKVEEIVDETGLTCRHCEQHFTSVSNLRRHAIRHLGWKRFKCRLCRFCSYNRSECNTHIVRSHFERVRLGSNNARIDSFITDLGRQGASVRSLKKRRTLDRQRQGEGAGKEETTYTHIRSSSRKTQAAHRQEGEMPVEQVQDNSVDAESSSPSPLSTRSGSRARTVVAATTESSKAKPTNSTSFNISTRNSPRKFDIRPYSRDNNPSTLNTRKGAYTKKNIFSAPNVAEAGAEEKKVDSSGKDNVSGLVTGTTSLPVDKDSTTVLHDTQPEAEQNVENSSPAAAKQDRVSVEQKLDSEQVKKDQDMGPVSAAGDKITAGTVSQNSVASTEREGHLEHQEEEKSEFVVRRHDDGDLMDVEETLPERFMSDDDD